MVASIFASQQPAFRKTFSPQAEALFARMSPQPDMARKDLIDTLITSLVDSGAWDKFDVFYVTAAHTAQAARLNWVSPNYGLTPVNSPAFVADIGYSGDGSTSYLRTGFNPATIGGVKYSQNDAHAGVWPTSNQALISRYDFGVSRAAFNTRQSTNTIAINVNGTAETAVVLDSTSIGHLVAVRTASNSGFYRKNGNSYSGNFSTASTTLPNAEFFLSAFNSSTSGGLTPAGYSSRVLSAFHCGSSLTAQQNLDTYNALRDFFTAIGIP